ncbi:bifunctional phosphoribosyl-AMP cyclohydrolase/phosphoribosyl-ATP diphosphatase HisIE [Wenzhouxiangella sediminis]|jgi:phosphoribosyl-ATP pyrophosphohydrolase/phosphoribosyl-AMP cyclohydrolase|uniref:Histidine biosynthesis bifunctional protein HisIE n=1 Tax=Wenzhouxiangella sediminis TaxID=1792836 RepID=A0A3E1K7V3_9GAMM|nr:bifunctional phosphoribosyl-AMP cyclohydrolase/phosphoribosyl-ATP diphosphatase HisIE [Wenzhouxiangella sediminis]RFF30027.1 bifunctional phosphoribosyl-AMP cyclohydrolase/phosphoribosyl-ATP diphosphatase HisIE [Wenzhouxiangella sediminis]
MNNKQDFEDPDWSKSNGLLPAIVQDADDGRVLMLGYMNAEALKVTRSSGRVTFYSRSKQRLWTKGETSGNHLELVDVLADCDRDTLLVLARPHGPTCHTGTDTCFGNTRTPRIGFLAELERTIADRAGTDPEKSYTARLLAEGSKRCAQKVGEEGVEVALAAASGDRDELASESADLLYHLLVSLRSAGTDLESVLDVLIKRHRR